jgi:hypothetical protein
MRQPMERGKMAEHEPFNPSDPMDAMSEMFRRQITDVALEAYKVTLYREMDPGQQLQCFFAGALTGFIGVCLASVPTAGADAMVQAIIDGVPGCRTMAESIADKTGKPLGNHHDVPVGQPQGSAPSPQPAETAGDQTGGGQRIG